MIVLGPIIFGFILGLVLGSQIKSSEIFTPASYIAIIIAGIIVAWQLGQFPFYNDLPIATGFVSALVGVLVGKFLFARGSAN